MGYGIARILMGIYCALFALAESYPLAFGITLAVLVIGIAVLIHRALPRSKDVP